MLIKAMQSADPRIQLGACRLLGSMGLSEWANIEVVMGMAQSEKTAPHREEVMTYVGCILPVSDVNRFESWIRGNAPALVDYRDLVLRVARMGYR